MRALLPVSVRIPDGVGGSLAAERRPKPNHQRPVTSLPAVARFTREMKVAGR